MEGYVIITNNSNEKLYDLEFTLATDALLYFIDFYEINRKAFVAVSYEDLEKEKELLINKNKIKLL